MRRRRFVILDRDGTLIVEKYYLADPKEVELIRGAGPALRQLRDLDLGIIVTTNQSAIGRGFFDPAVLERIHGRLTELLANHGVKLDGIYFCGHTPEDDCICRKPRLGLLEQAMRAHSFDPVQSFVIGDKAVDIEFGQAAGATTILVRTGYGREVEENKEAAADYVVDDLVQAAGLISKIIAGGIHPERNEQP